MYPVVPLILIYTLASVPAPSTLPVLTTTWYHVKYATRRMQNIQLHKKEIGVYISFNQTTDGSTKLLTLGHTMGEGWRGGIGVLLANVLHTTDIKVKRWELTPSWLLKEALLFYFTMYYPASRLSFDLQDYMYVHVHYACRLSRTLAFEYTTWLLQTKCFSSFWQVKRVHSFFTRFQWKEL